MERPYSPETLADRWGCLAEKVRTMYRNGELDWSAKRALTTNAIGAHHG